MKEPIFKATHIVKQFGPTIALNDVDIEIFPGEIRGFIGENGSGKSTMSAIMTGIYTATSGTMEYHGQEWHPASMIDALSKGIGIIVQENGTIGEISVAENIFLGELGKFAGRHFFEEKKVESFSPLFDLDLSSLDALMASHLEKAKALKADLDASEATLSSQEASAEEKAEAKKAAASKKQEAKSLAGSAKVEIQKEYESLNEKLLASNAEKEKAEDASFDERAQKLFDEFQEGNKAINEKYDKNEEGVEQYLVERRRKADLETAKENYKKSLIALRNVSFMRRGWLKDDVASLKNHYLNGIAEIKAIHKNPKSVEAKNRFLDIVFGLFVNGKKLRKHAALALHKIGVNDIQPGIPTMAYDMQARKLIEIAKCLNKDPEIFIVDETTTALSETGRNLLYKKMNELKEAGKSVLFISHDLEELMEKCDTLTVLRDGSIVANLSKEKGEFDADAIKKFMIGRELKGDYYRSDYDGSHDPKVVLKMVDGIQGRQLRHVNLELHKGEILGVGGLSECGMHTLGKALFGNAKLEGGFVYTGEELNKLVSSESVAMKNRIGYLSKNRDTEALALKSNIFDNIAIASINNIAKGGLLVLKSDEKKLVNKQVRDLQIKCNSPEQLVSTLSGGNKQKVSLAKWIANDSEILILDCPTRGVDIGVKQFIYQLLYRMKKEGKAILMISEELPELIGMSDRILIMKDGQVTKEFARSKDLTQEEIVGYMI